MIYYVYSTWVQKNLGLPEIGFTNGVVMQNRLFKENASADTIFTFKDNKTVYLKNRFDPIPNGYQFSEEERLIIALKAVPL